MSEPAYDCRSEQCRRQTTGPAYCCKLCADAWEATPRYEPHAHSAACEARTPEWLKEAGW